MFIFIYSSCRQESRAGSRDDHDGPPREERQWRRAGGSSEPPEPERSTGDNQGEGRPGAWKPKAGGWREREARKRFALQLIKLVVFFQL